MVPCNFSKPDKLDPDRLQSEAGWRGVGGNERKKQQTARHDVDSQRWTRPRLAELTSEKKKKKKKKTTLFESQCI